MVTKLFKTVTDNAGQTQTTEHTEQKDMEAACLAEGTARMTQNHVTPFCQPPLRDLLGPYPSETDVQNILYGIYEIPPNTDPYARRLLQALKLPKEFFTEEGIRSPDSILPATITEAEHKAQWKRKKESTAAEPSGLSFTHYKAGSYDDDINAIDTFLRNTPRKHGFSPLAWQSITDFTILKKAGVFDVEKMRIIQLMHSEFNANNQFDGRAMMRNAEKHGTINHQQQGSRKNLDSRKADLCKLIGADIMRQKILAGCIISNDAKSCYDRIQHIIAFLAMMRQGLAYTAVLSQFLTLQYAIHFVLTGWGRSKTHYGGKTTQDRLLNAIQGIGQGNGAGPAIWAVISTVLIEIMQVDGYTACFVGALTHTMVHLACIAFVDDTDLFHTAPNTDTRGETLLPAIYNSLIKTLDV